MKNLLKIMVVAAAIASLAIASAQPGGGGQGRGQGRGGMMGMMRGGGQGGALALLGREDVKDDLGITSEQNSQLKAIQDGIRDKMMAKMQESGISFGGGQRPDMAEMQKIIAPVMKEIETEMEKVLKPEQKKRLDEIDVQLSGNRIAQREKYQKLLELTPDQIAKVKKLGETAQQANQAVMEKARNQEIEWTEVRTINEKNSKALDAEIGKVLTQPQKDKIKEWSGKPFVAKDDN
jgi:Spy/CpxP family protein refolding chaperone